MIAIVEVASLILASALLLLKMAIYFFLSFIDSLKELYAAALHAFTTRSTETQTRRSVVTPKMIIPDRYCATKPAINDELSTPIGDDDLNQHNCLHHLMDKVFNEKTQILLEKERLANELSRLQYQLMDSNSKLRQSQNELAITKSQLENNKRLITDVKANLFSNPDFIGNRIIG
jgi:peptidoglycan hydrolase CwlO-like protein